MIRIFERFEHTFSIKSIDKEKRIIRGIGSLEIEDRDHEIVALKAIDDSLQTYLSNPIVRYKHKDPIGKAKKEGTYIDWAEKAFIVTAYITDKTQAAKEAWGLILDGILKSFSIGGKVLEKETIKIKETGREVTKITKMELYEVSIVDIPSNRKSFFEVIAKSIEGDVEKDRMRDQIANELYNLPYDSLTEEQKKKVHEEALRRRGGKPGEGRNKDVTQDLNKPFAGYANFAECVADQKKKGKSEESAKKICGKLQAQHEKIIQYHMVLEEIEKRGLIKKKHSAKWHRCVDHVTAAGGVRSPEAVCTAVLGADSYV